MTTDRGQVDPATLHGFGTVLEIAAHGALAMVEVEGDDIGPATGERDGDMDCRGRFAGPALLIGENDAMGLRIHQDWAVDIMLAVSLSNPWRGGNACSPGGAG